MLIEYPIQLVNRVEKEVLGEESADTTPGKMTVTADAIRNVFENNTDFSCHLEFNDGTSFLIMLPYQTTTDMWKKALEMNSKPFFTTYLDNVPKKEPQKLNICTNCGGQRFAPVAPESKATETSGEYISIKCLDCGMIIN